MPQLLEASPIAFSGVIETRLHQVVLLHLVIKSDHAHADIISASCYQQLYSLYILQVRSNTIPITMAEAAVVLYFDLQQCAPIALFLSQGAAEVTTARLFLALWSASNTPFLVPNQDGEVDAVTAVVVSIPCSILVTLSYEEGDAKMCVKVRSRVI
jgi:hypothetical protein